MCFSIDVHLLKITLQVKAEDVNGRVETILEELRTTRNEVSSLRSKIAVLKAASLANKATTIDNTRYDASAFAIFTSSLHDHHLLVATRKPITFGS